MPEINMRTLMSSPYFFILLPLVVFFFSLVCGRYPVDIKNVVGILISQIYPVAPFWPEIDERVIINLRLPRLLIGMLIGAGLAVSGAAFQGIFKNPLVSPHILGVAAGAGFGGVLAMLLSQSSLLIFIFAFIFGNMAVLASYLLARKDSVTPVLVLVLAGVIISAFFTAMISLLKLCADPQDQLPGIVFWLMGSLISANYEKFGLIIIPFLICIYILWRLRWRINVLSQSDQEARALGVNVEYDKWIIILCVSVIVALAVSVSGIIGWVGLAIPHIARMIVGSNHQFLIPACISLGAAYFAFVDTIARSLTPYEIPLGILTAIVGVVIFGYLLKRNQNGGWNEY